MKRMMVMGRTFDIKDQLKNDGFRWNPEKKCWSKNFKDDDELLLKLADYYDSMNGVSTEIKTVSDPDERKYYVKESWIFNLESMHDKLWVLENDLDEHRLEFPLKVAGRELKNWDDFAALREEVYNMEGAAKSGKVTGREYGRIREIVAWRVEVRYATCLAAGMEESKAGQCFEDM